MQFVKKTSPWLPEKGTLDEEAWKKVGIGIKQWMLRHPDEDDAASENVVSYRFVVKQAFDHAWVTDLPNSPSGSAARSVAGECTPLISKPKKHGSLPSPAKKYMVELVDTSPDSSENEGEPLDLEEEATKYHNPGWPPSNAQRGLPKSRLAAAAREPRKTGDPLFQCVPILLENGSLNGSPYVTS
jgi:hypothetical protein